MKKAGSKSEEMRAEYNFAKMKGRARGKYARQYRSGTNVVLLDPDVCEAFPTAAAVNQALRALLAIIKSMGPRRTSR